MEHYRIGEPGRINNPTLVFAMDAELAGRHRIMGTLPGFLETAQWQGPGFSRHHRIWMWSAPPLHMLLRPEYPVFVRFMNDLDNNSDPLLRSDETGLQCYAWATTLESAPYERGCPSKFGIGIQRKIYFEANRHICEAPA